MSDGVRCCHDDEAGQVGDVFFFFGAGNGTHRWKLFNLKNDLGEKTDLAAQEPERVKAMDALIERFLTDTKAVTPVVNPAFNPALYDPAKEGISTQNDKPKKKPAARANKAAKPPK